MLNDCTDISEYTGECYITKICWAVPEDGSTWGTMRAAMAYEASRTAPYSNKNIGSCANELLNNNYPIFKVGQQLNVYVSSWTEDWDEFIRAWAAVYAEFGACAHADDEEEMAAMLEASYIFEAIEGETVDEFNTRLWLYEVEGTMDALSDDFADLSSRLEIGRTAYHARYGVA